MSPTEVRGTDANADVCLVLEGTYPYVRGGVSTWVHDLMGSLPRLRFAVVHVGSERGTCSRRAYAPPDNLVAFADVFCREPLVRGTDVAALQRAAYVERHRHARSSQPLRVLRALGRLHLEDRVDSSLLDDLAARDLSVAAFLHGRASFELTIELYERLAPEASFLDFFWHFRSMHLPLVRLLDAEPPAASVYHAVCTGYAGLLGAVWSHQTGRPLLLTEHGIYTRERNVELDRAAWLHRDGRRTHASEMTIDGATASSLRRMWMGFFRTLARCAYRQAATIVSLCEVSRRRQIADGAPADRTLVVPNGIDAEDLHARLGRAPQRSERREVRIGFVGRVVPIKDVVTFLRACQLVSQVVPAAVRIFGPIDEDRPYARRCRRLVAKLGLQNTVRFEGSRTIDRVYPEIDILVLTSFSEGQPFVILEAGAAGIPVVATDVGACREMIEGRTDEDRRIGASGIVTPLAAPEATAEAIVRLARSPGLRRLMGEAGGRRVARFYRKSAVFATYEELYAGGAWQELAGASSA